MSFSFTSPAIALSNVNTKWREKYGSSSFNKKLAAIIPAGIYRGFILGTSGSNNTVTVNPDSVHLDHVAVYETSDGWSLSVRDMANTVYSLPLTDSSLLNQTVVVAIFADYQEGKDTSINFAAYTVAEYTALPANLKSELVVLGTVVNPPSGNLITSGNITNDRRTVASFTGNLLTWRPLVQNPGFERSPTGQELLGFQAEGWTSSGSWKADNSDVGSGTRCAIFAPASGGTYTEFLRQYIGAGVVAGQQILIKLSKKVTTAATSGSATIEIGFAGDSGAALTPVTSSFVINSTDSSYQLISTYLTAPSGAVALTYIGIKLTSAVYAGGGTKLRVDNLTASLQPASVDDQLNFLDERQRTRSFTAAIFEDSASTDYADIGAAIRFKKSVPTTSEGRLELIRKDAGTGKSPAFYMPGRLLSLGSSLIALDADAMLPRVEAPVGTAGTFTLMWESARAGETTGTYTQGVLRKYASSDGRLLETVNALWDGSAWNKDVTGTNATKIETSAAGVKFYTRASDTAWSDGAWDNNVVINDGQVTTTSDASIGGALAVTNAAAIGGESIASLSTIDYHLKVKKTVCTGNGNGGQIWIPAYPSLVIFSGSPSQSDGGYSFTSTSEFRYGLSDLFNLLSLGSPSQKHKISTINLWADQAHAITLSLHRRHMNGSTDDNTQPDASETVSTTTVTGPGSGAGNTQLSANHTVDAAYVYWIHISVSVTSGTGLIYGLKVNVDVDAFP